ncbi:MAG TPA: MFS transporter [Opitutaceae bacterium]|nr:MFS transporter [Opitutaceae bacterium]
MKLPRNLHPLRYRNYRLYFFGQAISLIGTWMTTAATLWLAYKLTGSTFYVGAAGFANLIPSFLLSPFAGVWVDRVNRLKLFGWCQVILMIQSLGLAALALTGVVNISHILILNVLQGVVNAFDVTVRQAMVRDFVENKEDLATAIALNSSNFNLARLIGPAIGGMVVAAFGPGICFLVDGISYIAVLGCIAAMNMPRKKRTTPMRHPLHELHEGWVACFHFAPIRELIVLVAIISFASISYTVLMPEIATEVFHGDARTMGYMMAAVGCGALSSAIYLGSRKGMRGLNRVITCGCTALGFALVGLAFVPWLPLALVCLFVIGSGAVLLFASSNTLIQAMIEDHQRGRIMSIFSMAYTGAAPLGNLLTGSIAGRLGAKWTLVLNGIVCLTATYGFWRRSPALQKESELRLHNISPEANAVANPE